MSKKLLIVGLNPIDRLNQAILLAKSMMCLKNLPKGCECQNCIRIDKKSHPNLFLIAFDKDETSEIKLEEIQKINLESQKACFEEGPSVFIINNSQNLTKSAANALLKTLEEIQNRNFFLLAPSRFSVLPTISSRLQIMRVKPSSKTYATSSDFSQRIEKITKTAPYKRLHLLNDFSLEKNSLLDEIHQYMETLEKFFWDNFEKNPQPKFNKFLNEYLSIGKALLLCEKNLLKNLNPKLVLEELLFNEWPYSP